MEPETHDQDVTNLAVAWAADGPFVRRGCPSCGLEFKTEVNAAQYISLLAPAIRRAGQGYGLDLEPAAGEVSESVTLTCPYCGDRIAPEKSHTIETWLYVRRLAYRELVLPAISQLFSGLEDLKGGFISIEFSGGPQVLPPRPVHGPEPPDMLAVRFLCCGGRAKVLAAWASRVACPACGEITETW